MKIVLLGVMAAVLLGLALPAAALAADVPNVDTGSAGYQGLNPAAQMAAQVIGYGHQTGQPYCAAVDTCLPNAYMNLASKIAANAIGYYENNVVVQEPTKNPDNLPVQNQ